MNETNKRIDQNENKTSLGNKPENVKLKSLQKAISKGV